MALQRRILSEKERTACQMHMCNSCELPIFPGDQYLVTVEIRRNDAYRMLWVRKEHVYPFCPYDPDEDRTGPDSNVIPFPVQLPLAA
jgi:hypothetical protein